MTALKKTKKIFTNCITYDDVINSGPSFLIIVCDCLSNNCTTCNIKRPGTVFFNAGCIEKCFALNPKKIGADPCYCYPEKRKNDIL